ncbi:unnamed protein product [Thelazia callipaeda]|uniref:Uncharacterized protein n=1 Tax=Thelazia callipaeda TaxID=103827 RepID=A0A0N5D8P0_THECL|nr:unnamed protein product [Thelazia callipaeda]
MNGHFDGTDLLTINISQLGSDKQCAISPHSSGSLPSADTLLREGNAENRSELGLIEQGPCEQALDDYVDGDAKTKGTELSLPSEYLKSDNHRDFEKIDSAFTLQHRSLWSREKGSLLKIDESQAAPSSYEFNQDEICSQALLESGYGISELKEAEIRRARCPRAGIQPEIFTPQQIFQKSSSEKRKQKSRRRGKGLRAESILTHLYQPEDVYEFRSSPDSDININSSAVHNMAFGHLYMRRSAHVVGEERSRKGTVEGINFFERLLKKKFMHRDTDC